MATRSWCYNIAWGRRVANTSISIHAQYELLHGVEKEGQSVSSYSSSPTSQRPHFTGDGHTKPLLKEVNKNRFYWVFGLVGFGCLQPNKTVLRWGSWCTCESLSVQHGVWRSNPSARGSGNGDGPLLILNLSFIQGPGPGFRVFASKHFERIVVYHV